MMRRAHFYQRLTAEEQRQVNQLRNRVLVIYAVLITVALGLAAVKMPDSGSTEARAASAIATQAAK